MEDFNKEVTKESGEKPKETAEQFKNRIDGYFIEFGLDLSSIPEVSTPEKFYEWKNQRYEETDKEGVTLEEKVIFRIELAYAYILSKDDNYAELAWEELDDAQTMAEGGNLEELAEKIDTLMGSLENKDD